MDRRTFLHAAAAAAASACAPSPEAPSEIPIIDTHIHLFDIDRPQGVPWPPKDDPIRYKTASPERYREVTKSLGVTGAIKVEASPWFDDNQWALDAAATDPIMVGVVGNLEPGEPEFRGHIERFTQDPLFLGIRYAYLWGRDLREQLDRAEFMDDLRFMAEADLTLDTANQSVRLLEDVVRISDEAPALRVVLDHLPNLPVPEESGERARYSAAMRELGQRPQVYVKVSAVLQRKNGEVSYNLDDYRPKLDEIWETFGQDRLIYGSDWPNSDPLGPYPEVLKVVRDYFAEKGREASEKYFWKNSVEVYRWVKRAENQPG